LKKLSIGTGIEVFSFAKRWLWLGQRMEQHCFGGKFGFSGLYTFCRGHAAVVALFRMEILSHDLRNSP
jgi:hypothetical protein